MAQMFGYDVSEMIGQPSSAVFPSYELYRAFRREAAPLLGQGLPFELAEYEFKRKDGSLFWCRVRAKAVDASHHEGGTIWILEDVTVSRQMQMEVEAIMTNASMSILFTKNRVITRYNRGFAEMFRYQGDAALGLPGMALYPSRAAYEALGAKAYPFLSVGKPFQTEIEMRRADDTLMWAQLIVNVVNPENPTQGTIWVIEDRTEQNLTEESLRQAKCRRSVCSRSIPIWRRGNRPVLPPRAIFRRAACMPPNTGWCGAMVRCSGAAYRAGRSICRSRRDARSGWWTM